MAMTPRRSSFGMGSSTLPPRSSVFQQQQTQRDDLIRAQTQTANTRARVEALGIPAEPIKKPKFNVWSLFRNLSRTGYAANNLLQEVFTPEQSSTSHFDPLGAIARGFKLEETPTGGDLMRNLGVSDKKLFGSDKWYDPSAAGVLGVAADVFNPLDPLNWLGFGLKKKAAQGAVEGTQALTKAFGDDIGNLIARRMGDAAQGLSGANVGELSKNIMKAATQIDTLNVDELVDLLGQGVKAAGTNPATKISGQAGSRIAANVIPPMGRETLFSVGIPGTEALTWGGRKATEFARSTRIGDWAGKAFKTGYKSNKLPDSVLAKNLEKSSMGRDLIPEAAGVTTDISEAFTRTMTDMDIPDEIQKQVIKAVDPGQAQDVMTSRVQNVSARVGSQTDELSQEIGEQFARFGINDKASRRQVLEKVANPDLEVPENIARGAEYFKSTTEAWKKDLMGLGLDSDWLDNYIPFVARRRLTKAESEWVQAMSPKAPTGGVTGELADLLSQGNINPGLQPRQIAGQTPMSVNDMLDKPWLSEDALEILMIRGKQHLTGMEVGKLAQEMTETFGIPVEEFAKNLNKIPKGYGMFVKAVDETTGATVMRKVTKLTEKTKDEMIALPEEFARIFNDYMGLITNPDNKSAFLSLFDKGTTQWKNLAYTWNPGHVPRDTTGNMWQSYLMGVRNPVVFKHSAEAFKKNGIVQTGMEALTNKARLMAKEVPNFDADNIKQLKRLYKRMVKDGEIERKLIKIHGREIDPMLAFLDATKTGALGTLGTITEAPKKLMSTVTDPSALRKAGQKYDSVIRELTETSNNWARFGGYLDQLGKGLTPQEAAAQVKKFYFDYFDLTPFEKKVMKRIMPFYTWTRKNIPMEIEALIKRPRDFQRVQKVADNIQGGPQDENEMPSWAKDQGFVRLGKDGDKYLHPNMPYQDLSRIPVNSKNIANLLSMLNPLIRAPIEWSTNRQLFSGQELEDYPGEKVDAPFTGIMAMLEKMGIDTPDRPQVSKRNVDYFLRQLPILSNIDVMTDPENPRQMARVGSSLGIPRRYDAENIQASALYEQNRELMQLIQYLRDQGIEVPTLSEVEQMQREGSFGGRRPIGK